ncbi:MAG: LytTR family transcriptional regulator [Prevotellaceae bacterium]|jgi:DNA-binding LytR/AlgR family response regulator|nr:LytTR family transcriptional regulator [Prevotellaceae bacterium]
MCKYLAIETKEETMLLTLPLHLEEEEILLTWINSNHDLAAFLEKAKSPLVRQLPNPGGVVTEAPQESIFIKDRDYFRKIDFSDILWIEASGSYCCIYQKHKNKICLSFSLSEISAKLPSKYFLRIHRSYIVNIIHIDAFIGNIICVGESKLPISKVHKKEVIGRINVLGGLKSSHLEQKISS